MSPPGVQVVVPEGAEFNIVPELLDPSVLVLRPTEGSPFKGLGEDLAVVDQEYTLTAYGDGTACLTGPVVAAGRTLYLPSPRYEDQGKFAPENGGFWQVERVHLGPRRAHLRRLDGAAGMTQTIRASSPADIQTGMAEQGSALVVGILPGLWPIAAATSRWVAIRIPFAVPETPSAVFEKFLLAKQFIRSCEVRVDQLAMVRCNGKAETVLVPSQAGVEAEMAHFDAHGFLTSIDIENLSTQPMKLSVVFRLG